MKMLNNVAGGIFDSFNRWKTIPETSNTDNY